MAGPGRCNAHSALSSLVLAAVVTVVATQGSFAAVVGAVAARGSSSDLGSAFWDLSEFGPCTAQCGKNGGVQGRQVRCLKSIMYRGIARNVQTSLRDCPQPAPAAIKTCNKRPCLAEWRPLEWSECSTTCGMGTQTREVRCESLWSSGLRLPDGARHQVSASQCGAPRPGTSRNCHVIDCPFFLGGEKGQKAIRAENYTLWQLAKTRRIRVNVGGEVNLLPGQTVTIRCPVRDPSLRNLRYWSKGLKLESFKDVFTIPNAEPERDEGTYTCSVYNDASSVTIKFINGTNPTTDFYKKWVRKHRRSKGRRRLSSPRASRSRSHRSRGANNDDNDDNSNSRQNQQRDQSRNVNRRKPRKQKRPLTLTFVADSWSSCNATCSSSGQRSRQVTCSHVTRKFAKVLPEERCLRAGLKKPKTTRECWHSGRCAVWRAGPWSKCYPSCGQPGQKTRYLVCEWNDTKQLALDACDASQKPLTSKPCKTKPCPGCRDKSRSCARARSLRMCRYTSFRRQCCQSCKASQNLGPNDTLYRKSYRYYKG